MKSVLIFLFVGLTSSYALATFYGDPGFQVDVPNLDQYKAFPGMFRTLVTFIGDSQTGVPSTFSIASVNSPFPPELYTDKVAQARYALGLKKILISKGAAKLNQQNISSGRWGSHHGMVFVTTYELSGQKYQEAAVLLPADKSKSLSISFRATIHNFGMGWNQIQTVLKRMKIHGDK